MAKAPPKQCQQLEMPLLVNLNAVHELAQIPSAAAGHKIVAESAVRKASTLEATASDLNIYRSISDNFFRRSK